MALILIIAESCTLQVMQSQQYRYEKDETPPVSTRPCHKLCCAFCMLVCFPLCQFRFKPYFAVASNLLTALLTMMGFLLILPMALTDFGLYLLETVKTLVTSTHPPHLCFET